MKKLLVLLVIFSMLTAVGCSAASQTSALTSGTDLSQTEKPYKELTCTVVVFGPSILAMEPGPTGVAGRLEELTSFEVKDYSLLGGMATRIEGDSFSDISLVSILLYNEDKLSREMRDAIPDADYVIIAFGGNDHSMGIPASGDGESYENALLISVETIKKMNPDARIVLVGPTNGWGMEDGEYVFATELDFGGGKLGDYVDAMKRVAEKEDVLCVDMLDAWTFCEDDSTRYAEDGSHLTELGRRVYAEYLAKNIYDYYFAVAITPPSSALRPSGSS